MKRDRADRNKAQIGYPKPTFREWNEWRAASADSPWYKFLALFNLVHPPSLYFHTIVSRALSRLDFEKILKETTPLLRGDATSEVRHG